MAFQGLSRTLTQQSSAASSDDLQKILFSPEAIKKMATECDLGRHHWMRADNAISVRPLVPEVTHSKIIGWFKRGYEAGELRSKGYMSVPQVLCAVTRTVSSDAEGSVRIYLADLGDRELAPIDNQTATLFNVELPALVSFHPTYDCPMESIGNIQRCFAVVVERHGYVGHPGTAASVCSNWQAQFSSKNNNYKHTAAGKVLVLPFNRLADQTSPSAVARLLKSQLNVTTALRYVLPSSNLSQSASSELEPSLVESPPDASGSSSASRVVTNRPPVVNGL
ncbi:3a [Cucumber mosaic virus]|uniref:Movement protein n=1 Tax=Cucumber mosaic virus TaxID=12305 RepID=A0A140H4X2_9BROM|nr:3a [Cucumber mosaic virus]